MRDAQPKIIVEPDEARVEGGVVESVQANPISDVESFGFVARPRQNVRGHEKLSDAEARKPALIRIIIQNDFPEEVLSPSPPHECFGFRHCRRIQTPASNPLSWNNLRCLFGVFREKRVEESLALRDHLSGVRSKFLPDIPIKPARSRQTADSAQAMGRVERGKISYLH